MQYALQCACKQMSPTNAQQGFTHWLLVGHMTATTGQNRLGGHVCAAMVLALHG